VSLTGTTLSESTFILSVDNFGFFVVISAAIESLSETEGRNTMRLDNVEETVTNTISRLDSS
jgi:hypothetical protein